MRGPRLVLVLVFLLLVFGVFGVQIWLGERQLGQQKAQLAQQQAAFKLWQIQQQHQPRVFVPPPPVLPTQPTLYPWFLWWQPLIVLPAVWFVAAEQQRLKKLQHKEEEEQTPYTAEDLMENWEFKIIRCPLPLFEQPAFLENVLREEALAGWQLLEKFDGTRVRLKRLAGQPLVTTLPAGYDPYRTAIRPNAKIHVLLWVLCILSLLLAPLFVVLQICDPISTLAFCGLLVGAIGVSSILAVLAHRQATKYRKFAKLTTQ